MFDPQKLHSLLPSCSHSMYLGIAVCLLSNFCEVLLESLIVCFHGGWIVEPFRPELLGDAAGHLTHMSCDPYWQNTLIGLRWLKNSPARPIVDIHWLKLLIKSKSGYVLVPGDKMSVLLALIDQRIRVSLGRGLADRAYGTGDMPLLNSHGMCIIIV